MNMIITREVDAVDTSNPGRIISGGNLHMDVTTW